jgi:small-conductance mechanosensitive channel
MFNLIIYALLAAGIAFGGMKVWTGFTGQYVAEGAQAQLAADKPLIEAAKQEAAAATKRAEQAEDDARRAVAAVAEQNAAIEAARAQAEAAVKAAREQALLYAGELAKSQGRISKLQAAAREAKKPGTCEEVLAATDAILTESLTLRRVQ